MHGIFMATYQGPKETPKKDWGTQMNVYLPENNLCINMYINRYECIVWLERISVSFNTFPYFFFFLDMFISY